MVSSPANEQMAEARVSCLEYQFNIMAGMFNGLNCIFVLEHNGDRSLPIKAGNIGGVTEPPGTHLQKGHRKRFQIQVCENTPEHDRQVCIQSNRDGIQHLNQLILSAAWGKRFFN